jgi:RNA polymerase sigma factor (sigma-70 family)
LLNYDKLRELAKRVALKNISDLDEAENIAQDVMVKLLDNLDSVDHSKVENWLKRVTYNLCMDYYRKKKKSIEITQNKTILENNSIPENIKLDFDLDFDSYLFLMNRDKEKKILKKFHLDGIPIQKIAQIFKLKQSKVKSIIYRLTNEIKLFHLIDNETLFFELVPSTRLTKRINNFILRLKYALEANDLNCMRRYLKNAKINDISKITHLQLQSCQIMLLDKSINKYGLVIAFFDNKNEFRFFQLTFKITKANNIEVIEFPIWPGEVVVLDTIKVKSSTDLNEFRDRNGAYNEKLGTIDTLKRKGLASKIQYRDTFED